MSEEILVKAEGVSKKFCRSLKRSLWYGVRDVTAEMIGRAGQRNELRVNEFWAVNNVSFELRRGECLGLIGSNGAGKSTLLKLLNGLVKPDKGVITIRGRVGALIELGAGFNPILTARENIYINGSVLGFSKREIDRKFDSIVDFSELEEFIDTPVQAFSSGMKVRLGFSVAAQMEPDLLLIDEVLAVGDYAFKTKCLSRLSELLRTSALIFVSHSMPLVATMSSQIMLFDRGSPICQGESISDIILTYLSKTPSGLISLSGKPGVYIKSVCVNGQSNSVFPSDVEVTQFAPLELRFEVNLRSFIANMVVSVAFFDQEGRLVAESRSANDGFTLDQNREFKSITLAVPNLSLASGKYTLQLSISELPQNRQRGDVFLQHKGIINLTVAGKVTSFAPVVFQGRWKCQ